MHVCEVLDNEEGICDLILCDGCQVVKCAYTNGS